MADIHVLDGQCALPPDRVGGKAWSINHIHRLGLPAPPAIVIGIDACRAFLRSRRIDDQMWASLLAKIGHIEQAAQRRLGGAPRPLLLSVRSGAARSMPGMMDTILNLGINDTVEASLADEMGAGFAADTRARFAAQFRAVTGSAIIPDDPIAQLRLATEAVFRSWDSERARTYRAHHGISNSGGTAVTVQAMVFGNLDRHSGTGVLFSRNPLTGAEAPYGEWLSMAQGEDVVSGKRTPEPLDALGRDMPEIHSVLLAAARTLEREAADVQDIEFTVESGRLWLLQTRAAKRSARAALKWAVALSQEGIIKPGEAVRRLSVEQIEALGRPALDPGALATAEILAVGEPAAPGIARGRVVEDVDMAMDLAETDDVILTRPTTAPEDIHGMIAARGIVTAMGGSTSHAAVVSREIGRPCIVGCGAAAVRGLAGLDVTIDGDTGIIYRGRLAIVAPMLAKDPDLLTLAGWAARDPQARSLLAALARLGVSSPGAFSSGGDD